MTFSLTLHYFQNVQRFEAFDCLLIFVYVFLENEREVVDHVPDQIWLLKNVQKGHKFTTNPLKHVTVVYLRIYQL